MIAKSIALPAALAAVFVFMISGVGAAEGEMENLLAFDSSRTDGGWRRWFPREEVSPVLSEESENGGTLTAAGGGLQYSIGGWERRVEGVKAGEAYHVSAQVSVAGMANPPRSLWIRVYWKGEVAGDVAPDAVAIRNVGDGRYVFDDRVVAADGATSALVRIIYRWDEKGTAEISNIRMEKAGPEAAHRTAKISTVYWRPDGPTTVENNLEHFLTMVDKAAEESPDFILLGEGIVSVGIGFSRIGEIIETVPEGKFFEAFAAKARQYNCHICYGTYERDGRYIFNTAVLIGRDGKLIGKYRKSHLPWGEDAAGLAPGNSIDVFDTDCAKVAMVICIETDYPEIIRTAVMKGAEIVLVPIWGGSVETIRMRARENGVYVATSSFDMKCMVVDKRGEVLAETGKGIGDGVATAEVDLDDRTKSAWTGDWPGYYRRMRWPEIYELGGGE